MSEAGVTPGVLFLLFLILKLVGVIHWSWWWVTAPLWGAFVLFALAAVLFVVFRTVALKLMKKLALWWVRRQLRK